MAALIFYICAVAVITGALGVVLAHNPVHSALFLLLTLVSIAILFLQQDAALVAIIQIVVYASAIVVLFVFVIALLGVDPQESLDEPLRLQRPVAIVLGAVLFIQIVVLAGRHWVTGEHSVQGKLGTPRSGNVRQLAESLFTDYVWAFEITAVLLVIAVVGGVALARRSGQRPSRSGAKLGGSRRQARGSRRQARGRGFAVIAAATLTPTYYLVLAAGLFTIGAVGLLVRRNTLVMFMCIELMLNAANLTFVSYSKALDDIGGQVIVFFTLVVAAAEVAVGLAIIVAIFRRRHHVTADDLNALEG